MSDKKDPPGVEVLVTRWASYALNGWEKYEKPNGEPSRVSFMLRYLHDRSRKFR